LDKFWRSSASLVINKLPASSRDSAARNFANYIELMMSIPTSLPLAPVEELEKSFQELTDALNRSQKVYINRLLQVPKVCEQPQRDCFNLLPVLMTLTAGDTSPLSPARSIADRVEPHPAPSHTTPTKQGGQLSSACAQRVFFERLPRTAKVNAIEKLCKRSAKRPLGGKDKKTGAEKNLRRRK
jgi:hypothetical protein